MKTLIICTRCGGTYDYPDPEAVPASCHVCEYPGIIVIQYPAAPEPERVLVNISDLRTAQIIQRKRAARGASVVRG